MDLRLLSKYNVPGPRYTSYPTVPYWDEKPPAGTAWEQIVRSGFADCNARDGMSLYIHLPFCERLCTFCGCNKRITVNHKAEQPYIEAVLQEWQLYLDIFGAAPKLAELHLGGGTPTFFSPENLQYLIRGILEPAGLPDAYEFSLEAHPNVTRPEHLQVLYALGFRRVSFGIQDFDPRVQQAINRHQTYEQTREITEAARKTGYTSVNYDLVFGLPFQTVAMVRDTIDKVKTVMPERIAFYSYAHVPWKSPSQRGYSEADLPQGEAKRKLYETGRELLEAAGYIEIGMDHFALKEDALYRAAVDKTLHRNFMGYTPFYTELLIGLGMSSISDAWGAYIQNNKVVEDYMEQINSGTLPILRGHLLSEEDRVLRQHILNIMCHFETSWEDPALQHPAVEEGLERMPEMEADGLVDIEEERLSVTEKGRPFIRNICMALDGHLWRTKPESQLFSQTV